uniref:Uncharacterized protein n=1 Tax=Labrus bergylta TaxID=56723 RepID=A0A3Q3EEV5_9LABR
APTHPEIFDNEEYDCRTPEDWLACSADGKTVHGKALLPTENNIPSDDPESSLLEYSWHLVAVLEFSKEKCQYLVQKVHQNTNCLEVNTLQTDTGHWVPRIRLLFIAEDPRVFVERIQFALRLRDKVEALIFYHLTVDCMPTWSETPSLILTVYSVSKHTLSTPGLSVEKCLGDLEMEVKLDYERTMNRMIFDKVVQSQSEDFSHINLPETESVPESVPQSGKAVSLESITLS